MSALGTRSCSRQARGGVRAAANLMARSGQSAPTLRALVVSLSLTHTLVNGVCVRARVHGSRLGDVARRIGVRGESAWRIGILASPRPFLDSPSPRCEVGL